ncbi:MAG: aminopeptidase, partial [Fusobacterium mortiferum]
LDEEFAEDLKSDVADLKHMGARWGGAISAAKFLEIFAEGTPWTHMDIAGTAYNNSSKWYKKGASGVHVRGLYEYCKNR